MNILRKTRKSNIKISRRRILLLIFSLIMTSFAWIAYIKILKNNFEVHINSWDISVVVDKNGNGIADEEAEAIEEAIEISFLDMYPGIDQEIMHIFIKNNGEVPSTITYEVLDVKLLGEEYSIQEDAEKYRSDNQGALCLQNYNFIGDNTQSIYGDLYGNIYSKNIIDEQTVCPFKFIIEHTGEIDGGAEGYLKIKTIWESFLEDEVGLTQAQIDAKNESDSIWGNKIALLQEQNPGMPALEFKIKIKAVGLGRSNQFVMTQKVTPENYGDYVDYPIDLDRDGNTTNDWQIFYEDNENVYIISDSYINTSKTSISPSIFLKGTGSYSNLGVSFNLNSLSGKDIINQSVANKAMLTLAQKNTNYNYFATEQLLNPNIWNYFVEEEYADFAIGAPTIEMFIRSWNQKYIENENFEYLKAIWQKKNKGYVVNDNNEVIISNYNNAKLYFPHNDYNNIDKTEQGDCVGYWLASPSANSNKSLMNILYNGKISYEEIDAQKGIGLRPIVRLKSELKGNIAAIDGNSHTIWNLGFINE